ncbi:MAG: aminoacetone oxidase family FAD-binding enzyme [Thermoanaerobaculia bacterium]
MPSPLRIPESLPTPERVDLADLVVIGAGAAGLMAAIQAAREAPGLRILVLDGARSLGAKILVAGGGRCNVTHFEVSAADFAGSSRNAIAKVLRQLPVAATIDFFRGIGIELKREPTGKLFPVTDQARTVLEALLRTAREAGVKLLYPRRVTAIAAVPEGFTLTGEWGGVTARRVVLAAGGQALPKSGSDGSGFTLARALGHTTTATIFPSLVPLVVPETHWMRGVQGIAVPARIEVRSGSGKRLTTFRGDLLCTHFGLSGPVVLDASRHFLAARQADPQARFVVAFLPDATAENLALELTSLGRRSLGRWLAEKLPDRLADALLASASLDPAGNALRLKKEERQALLRALTEQEIPIVGDRGFGHAEATAGGIPLDQIRLETMESRACLGLHLCGEILDVDGRIGGFNFQWAWASGTVAGRAAAGALQTGA